jgi:hypothetical protein
MGKGASSAKPVSYIGTQRNFDNRKCLEKNAPELIVKGV